MTNGLGQAELIDLSRRPPEAAAAARRDAFRALWPDPDRGPDCAASRQWRQTGGHCDRPRRLCNHRRLPSAQHIREDGCRPAGDAGRYPLRLPGDIGSVIASCCRGQSNRPLRHRVNVRTFAQCFPAPSSSFRKACLTSCGSAKYAFRSRARSPLRCVDSESDSDAQSSLDVGGFKSAGASISNSIAILARRLAERLFRPASYFCSC